MEPKRKDERISIELSSSIKAVSDEKRNFCIIRNISRKGVYLTAKVQLAEGQTVECIISFGDKSISFNGIVRRTLMDQMVGYTGYGIEITEITQENGEVLDEFIEAGYLPEVEEIEE